MGCCTGVDLLAPSWCRGVCEVSFRVADNAEGEAISLRVAAQRDQRSFRQTATCQVISAFGVDLDPVSFPHRRQLLIRKDRASGTWHFWRSFPVLVILYRKPLSLKP